jgi:hypothetical protein
VIYGSEGRSPYQDDEIYAEMNPQPVIEDLFVADTEEEISNVQLRQVLEFYDCYDLLPYANHILWLSTVKEAIGRIPFDLGYEEICYLTLLSEEVSKKATFESQRMNQKSVDLDSRVSRMR